MIDLQYEVERHNLDFPCVVGYIEDMRRNIRFACEYARKKLGVVAKYEKENFDNRARPREYLVEDVVFKFSIPDAQRKIGGKWNGPFIVLDRIGATYKIKTKGSEEKVHSDQLRPWLDKNGMI